MARPTLDPLHAKSERVNLRLTPIELARLNERASRAGVPVAVFARAAALGREVRAQETTAPDFMTRNELRAIGNNLNQLARAANQGQDVPQAELMRVLYKLDALFDQWFAHGAERQQARP